MTVISQWNRRASVGGVTTSLGTQNFGGMHQARIAWRAAVTLCSAVPLMAWSAPENITTGELALLPTYCSDVQVIDPNSGAKDTPSPRAARWVSVMGLSFWHMHHYCWGLVHVRRAQAPGLPPIQRVGMIGSGINDYYYVIKNSPRDFVMAPEIFIRIGEARLLLREVSAAQDAFKSARELKPDYWPAYTRSIDVLLLSKQNETALALALEGLRHSPGAKELIDRYRKLGGDPSKIPAMASLTSAASAPQAEGMVKAKEVIAPAAASDASR